MLEITRTSAPRCAPRAWLENTGPTSTTPSAWCVRRATCPCRAHRVASSVRLATTRTPPPVRVTPVHRATTRMLSPVCAWCARRATCPCQHRRRAAAVATVATRMPQACPSATCAPQDRTRSLTPRDASRALRESTRSLRPLRASRAARAHTRSRRPPSVNPAWLASTRLSPVCQRVRTARMASIAPSLKHPRVVRVSLAHTAQRVNRVATSVYLANTILSLVCHHAPTVALAPSCGTRAQTYATNVSRVVTRIRELPCVLPAPTGPTRQSGALRAPHAERTRGLILSSVPARNALGV